MDIAAASVSMSQASLAQAVSIKVLSLMKDQMEVQGQNLAQMMTQSLDPNLGNRLDIRV
ncbi:YjfB family protein [Cohnella thailandensis]|jgi:hypothetical protein|uniref:YjfB family protein n=1 Tax=Cohnella thailandensis TaxID=557557 RepID=A0A841T420_9BACL|nr:YjfB family protein [Cohnella thailandensis]MBB6637385.1 YjfB family protein [Cohnella thailandensis]MBP1976714.1 hypothetical protein [Cohnella thailandensis]